ESSSLVAYLATNEGSRHSIRAAAEYDRSGRVLPREERRALERDDRQIGALAQLERADLGVETEGLRRAERRQPERLVRAEGARTVLTGAWERARRPELLEHVERRRGGGAVGAEADRHPRVEQRADGRDAAAEERIRARAVRDRRAALGQERDLLAVDLDAVGGDDVGPEQTEAREEARSGRARGIDQQVAVGLPRPASVEEVRGLGAALGEVRRGRQAELRARPEDVGRRRERRVRRDAGADVLGEAAREALAVGPEPRQGGGRVGAEDLDVDDRPEPEVGAGLRRGTAVAAVADRRHT